MEPPVQLCCPITLVLFQNPVRGSDNNVYERSALVKIVTVAAQQGFDPISPMTREKLKNEAIIDDDCRLRVLEFRMRRHGWLVNKKSLSYEPLSKEEETMIEEDVLAINALQLMGDVFPKRFTISIPQKRHSRVSAEETFCARAFQVAEQLGLLTSEAQVTFDSTKNGWSLSALKRQGTAADASLLVLEIISEEGERICCGAFNNDSWKMTSANPYGKEGFVFVNNSIYRAPEKSPHMLSRPNMVEFGLGALKVEDDFKISSDFSELYGSPPLTPVSGHFSLDRVRLFSWFTEEYEDEDEIGRMSTSVLNDSRYGAERMLLQVGMMNGRTIDRHHFS